MGNLAAQNNNLDQVISQTSKVVSDFNARRPELVASTGSMARVIRQLSTISDTVNPQLNEMITRQPGFTGHLVDIEPQLAFIGDNLPLMLKGLARITNEGAFGNAYACDLNCHRLLPRPQRCGADHRQRGDTGEQGVVHPTMQEHGQWLRRRLESYNKTWLGLIAVAVVAVVVGAMLIANAANVGHRHYTAKFLQAAALQAGQPDHRRRASRSARSPA